MAGRLTQASLDAMMSGTAAAARLTATHLDATMIGTTAAARLTQMSLDVLASPKRGQAIITCPTAARRGRLVPRMKARYAR